MIPSGEKTASTSSLDAAPLSGVNAADREAHWQKALQALGSLPPFSPILNKLLASLADESVSFSDLSALIEKDTVIAGNILHLANSALYARRNRVNSIGHALSLLGVNKLRNAVLGMSITRMWGKVKAPSTWSMARFNMHSAATAMLSDMLAQRLPVEYGEGAFVAGLLHDVGRLLIASGLPEQADQIAERSRDRENTIETEMELLGFSHPELSAEVLRIWKVPEPIRDAARDHHDPVCPERGRQNPLAALVGVANQYVNAKQISILVPATVPTWDPAALEALGMAADEQESVLRDFENEYSVLGDYFG